MRRRKSLLLAVSVMILVATLLPQHRTISMVKALGSSVIPFTEHTIAEDFNGATSVYATDIDSDGDVDVLGAAANADDIAWWENDGSQNFTEHAINTSFDGAESVYATDVDGDGDADVLAAASDADDITWWENDGSQNFTEHTIDGYFDGAESVYATDVDGDGDVDVLGAADDAEHITWWENDGSENFTEHTIDSDFKGASSVYAIDVDGDADMDVLGAAGWGFPGAGEITWWENDGNQNFTEHTIDGFFAGGNCVFATDLDGDGDVDVLGGGSWEDYIIWWENDGSQNFTEHSIGDDFQQPSSVYATDLDGDGDVDVLGASWWEDDIAWWENDGSQNFTQHTIDEYFRGPSAVYATDVDGDGDVDVLGAAVNADDIAWWENEQGPPVELTFLPVVSKNPGPPSSPPVLDDISNPDGDGSYTVSWSSVSRATEYVLQEDDNEEFTNPAMVYSGVSTSTTITGRDIGTYYYRVQATNSFGSSPWSNVVSVQVTTKPPEVVPEPGTWYCYPGSLTVRFTVSSDSSSVSNGRITASCGSKSIAGPAPIENGRFTLAHADGLNLISAIFDEVDEAHGGFGFWVSGSCWAIGTMTCSH